MKTNRISRPQLVAALALASTAAHADRVTIIDTLSLSPEEVEARIATAETVTASALAPIGFGLGEVGTDLGGGRFRFEGNSETFFPSPESLGLDTTRLLGADWTVEYFLSSLSLFSRNNAEAPGPEVLPVTWSSFFEAEVAGQADDPEPNNFEITAGLASGGDSQIAGPSQDAYFVNGGIWKIFGDSLGEADIPTDDLPIVTGGRVDLIVPEDLGLFSVKDPFRFGSIEDAIFVTDEVVSITYYLDTTGDTSGGDSGGGGNPNAIPTPSAAVAGLLGLAGVALRRRARRD